MGHIHKAGHHAPPRDHGPDPSLVFRYLSADLDQVERYRYDLETGTVTRHPGRRDAWRR